MRNYGVAGNFWPPLPPAYPDHDFFVAVHLDHGVRAVLGVNPGPDKRIFVVGPHRQRDHGVEAVGPVIAGAGAKEQAADDDAFPPEIRTLHAPRGRIAEAYRAVRTAIYFSTRGGGHQVIQVTSPTPGDGKSTLAANLAISIANSGKRVLLVDADFRRPRIHKLLRVPNDVGTSDIIEDSVEWLDALQSPKVDNLSVLTSGKHRKNPSELLTSRRFEEMLDAFREKFELVIIDSPPVMVVTDPLNVAPRVDGVLLVLPRTRFLPLGAVFAASAQSRQGVHATHLQPGHQVRLEPGESCPVNPEAHPDLGV